MSFDSFVISHTNEFAAATARAVAERPGLQYNPYLIWGDSGLGKTHLLHAIENYVKEVFPSKKVCYVTAENFLNDFTNAIRTHTNEQFRLKYRMLDVLLIDDVQQLAKKTETQIELFNTFNKMFDSNKQMVFSCDQPIEKVRDMEQRLVSRFSMGLTVALQPPDFELRMAILQNWAEANHLKMTPDAFEYVATNVTGNVRRLRGVFTTILIKASFNKLTMVTKQDAIAWLKDQITAIVNASPVSTEKIISETAQYYNLKPADLTGESRVKDIAYARQIAMYLARNLTTLSTTQIGSHFGNKQHGTVISNVNKIQTLLDQPDEQTRYDVDHLTKKVTEN
jgi:chromosomal replication initiator protein